MPSIIGFQGEIPRTHPRFLESNQAQICRNAKLERGSLTPYRRPKDIETLGSNAQTIYKHDDTWLSWNADVDVMPGPVDANRLYYTGDGVPKLYIGGTTYDLAVPRPPARLDAARISLGEFLEVDGKDVRLKNGVTRTTSGIVGDLTVSVTVNKSTARVTIRHDGLTEFQTAQVINNMRYWQAQGGDVSSLKIIRIVSLRDDGGKDYDDFGSPIGSDTLEMENVGTTVRVNGTTLSYTFDPPADQDSADVADQNDPPTLTTNGLNPTFDTDDSPVQLFNSTSVDTIEAGQKIIRIDIEVEGLVNGVVDPDQEVVSLYTYTYVTAYDEESEPAPLSSTVRWSPGVIYRLTGFQAPAGGFASRNIDRVRVYRSETGASGQTDLYFIAEISVGSLASFLDERDELEPQEPLPSLDYNKPPDDLKGLRSMPNGMMAAFKGKSLYFCEPYRPHAWPEKYTQVVDFDIVGIESFGSYLAVLTRGQPYIVQGTHPANVLMEKLEVNFPCAAKRSVVDMGGYVAYASQKGLVTIDATGAREVSGPLFTEYQWQQMDPSTFVCAQHEGRYVIAHTDAWGDYKDKLRCALVDLSGQVPFLVRVSWDATAFFYKVENSRLFYLDDNRRDIREFDNETGNRADYKWRSKQFIFTQPVGFSTLYIEGERGGSVAVRVYADGLPRGTYSGIGRAIRIKTGRLARVWEIELRGTKTITSVHLAGSPEEVAMLEPY